MKKTWITVLVTGIILITILCTPMMLNLWFNMTHASISYEISVTGLENLSVIEPVTILVPLPLICGKPAFQSDLLTRTTDSWNYSVIQTESGEMIAFTSVVSPLKDLDIRVQRSNLPVFQVPIADFADVQFSPQIAIDSEQDNSSDLKYGTMFFLPEEILSKNGSISVRIAHRTSSKYTNILSQANDLSGTFHKIITISSPFDTNSGWISVIPEKFPPSQKNVSYHSAITWFALP